VNTVPALKRRKRERSMEAETTTEEMTGRRVACGQTACSEEKTCYFFHRSPSGQGGEGAGQSDRSGEKLQLWDNSWESTIVCQWRTAVEKGTT